MRHIHYGNFWREEFVSGFTSIDEYVRKVTQSMAEIALTLSGGGFRAAMFHLGTLHYLRHLRYDDGRSLLDDVNVISTISGGSITGLWYMMNVCKGEDIDETIHKLYKILTACNIPSVAYQKFTEDPDSDRTLIKEMVDIYDELFFKGETFQLILGAIEGLHIHHFSANGTDFNAGLAFRFQATHAIKGAQPEHSHGFIGNGKHKLSSKIAGQIKLSEILAVSSCFPGGFEPLNFPSDFAFSKNTANSEYINEATSYELMDGGIVDNQGIEPILLANDQLNEEIYNRGEGKDANGNKIKLPLLDLIVVSDVASPNISVGNPFNFNWSKKLTLTGINRWVWGSVIISIAMLIAGIWFKVLFLQGVGATLSALTLGASLLICKTEKTLVRKLTDIAPFRANFGKVKSLRFYEIGKLTQTRLNSLLKLTQSVFMKPIRQMRYKSLYENNLWHNRLISNNVSELSAHGSWKWKEDYPDFLKPSEAMKHNSDLASSFETTLWFSEGDKAKHVPEALFTAGQYTICMNLLEYIDKLKKDTTNTNASHQRIISLETKLMKDWQTFKDCPRFMLLKQ